MTPEVQFIVVLSPLIASVGFLGFLFWDFIN